MSIGTAKTYIAYEGLYLLNALTKAFLDLAAAISTSRARRRIVNAVAQCYNPVRNRPAQEKSVYARASLC